jgi:hypothetical protein
MLNENCESDEVRGLYVLNAYGRCLQSLYHLDRECDPSLRQHFEGLIEPAHRDDSHEHSHPLPS